MNILIVGGAGHVGSIIRPALEAAHSCRYFDLRPVIGAEDRTVVGDVNDDQAVLPALKDMQAVVYLAMGVVNGNRGTVSDIDASFNVNVRGTYRFLNHGLAAGIRRFVYASTGSVYKNLYTRGVVNELTPTDTWEPYGLSKRVGEFLCQAAAQECPQATVIALRMHMPRNDKQWAVERNTVQAQRTHHQAPGDLRRLFIAALAYDKPGAYILQTSGDTENRQLPNTRATELLGWVPTDD